MRTTHRAWGAISTIAAAFGTVAAYAQNADFASTGAKSAEEGPLQEIVVTARRQSESLLRVPVAVSVVGEDELNRAAVADLGSVSRLAPQLIVSRAQNPGGASFVIRGIGTPPLDIGLEQSVAVNLDGMQLSRGKLAAVSLFDMQQVEVLKGPQALFFGKNSPAGVISARWSRSSWKRATDSRSSPAPG